MKFKPQQAQYHGLLELFGLSFGVDRIKGENSHRYIERIHDRFVFPPGNTYREIVSRIGRDLGIPSFYPFEIDVRNLFSPIPIVLPNVYAIDNVLTDLTASFEVDELVGKAISINNVRFEIIENSAQQIVVSNNSFANIISRMASPAYTIINVKNPMLFVTRSRILLYSNFIDDEVNEIDLEIELNNTLTISDIINEINVSSVSFSATSLPLKDLDIFHIVSRSIIPQNSLNIVTVNGAGSNMVNLGVTNLSQKGITSNDFAIFNSEKRSKEFLLSKGDYFVDRFLGEVTTVAPIPPYAFVSSTYNKFPIRPMCSVVILDDLRDKEYQRLLFQQVPRDVYKTHNDMFLNGKPLETFFVDYNLINRQNHIYWGK